MNNTYLVVRSFPRVVLKRNVDRLYDVLERRHFEHISMLFPKARFTDAVTQCVKYAIQDCPWAIANAKTKIKVQVQPFLVTVWAKDGFGYSPAFSFPCAASKRKLYSVRLNVLDPKSSLFRHSRITFREITHAIPSNLHSGIERHEHWIQQVSGPALKRHLCKYIRKRLRVKRSTSPIDNVYYVPEGMMHFASIVSDAIKVFIDPTASSIVVQKTRPFGECTRYINELSDVAKRNIQRKSDMDGILTHSTDEIDNLEAAIQQLRELQKREEAAANYIRKVELQKQIGSALY